MIQNMPIQRYIILITKYEVINNIGTTNNVINMSETRSIILKNSITYVYNIII